MLDVKPKSVAASWQPWRHMKPVIYQTCKLSLRQPWGTAETSQVECSERVHAIRMGGHQASTVLNLVL